ncbi:histidine triad nucleotide-binding protein [Alkalispirochaeta alkalica]|uniref:histidine triad nucleotide-binding protein n=1 Tax=Alkalispirochaeta alkalica TaxID=46356 RepID=UPI00037D8872|nr:histidine triad nucleotide-binding protein [Alkalispirochaeta alkalica]
MEETLFDRIIAGEIPADIVFENDHALAFRDINPQAPVHVLVVPRTRMRSIAEAPEQDPRELGCFVQAIAETAKALGLEEGGYRVVFNTGKDALQTVPYIHAHILGGRRLSWPPG